MGKSNFSKGINKEIWRLALPNIISNISVPLLSTVDTALMGHLSAAHLGAVGISSMIFNFLYWNFGFLRMGTTGMTAQAFGAKDQEALQLVLWRALGLGILIALLLLLFQRPLAHLSVLAFQVNPGQVALVQDYFNIRIWAAPAYMALLCLLGWFFGMQNAVIPLVITVVINVANMGMSYYFVYIQGYGIRGVAIGTVIAQYIGVVLAVFFIIWNYRSKFSKISIQRFFYWHEFKSFLITNQDLFLRTVLLTFVFAFYYSQSSGFGPLLLAISVVLMQFINWMSYGIDGIAFAAESIVGKYKGAGQSERLQSVIRTLFYWGLGFAGCYSLIFGLFGDNLAQIFSSEADVIQGFQSYIFWLILIPLIAFPSYLWDGIFIGLTASKALRNAMIIPTLLFIGIFYGFKNSFGLHGLILALTVFLLGRGLIQTWMYRRKGLRLK